MMRKILLALCLISLLLASAGCNAIKPWETIYRGKLVKVGGFSDQMLFEFDGGRVIRGWIPRQKPGCEWVVGEEYLFQTKQEFNDTYWRMVHPRCLQCEKPETAGKK